MLKDYEFSLIMLFVSNAYIETNFCFVSLKTIIELCLLQKGLQCVRIRPNDFDGDDASTFQMADFRFRL